MAPTPAPLRPIRVPLRRLVGLFSGARVGRGVATGDRTFLFGWGADEDEQEDGCRGERLVLLQFGPRDD